MALWAQGNGSGTGKSQIRDDDRHQCVSRAPANSK